MFLLYILAGVISGIIAGMGMGGGTLLIPILTIFYGIAQKTAQGVNLLAFIPMAIVALIIHFKNKLVDVKSGLQLIIFGVVFSIGGAILANYISNGLLRTLFSIFLLFIGFFQLLHIIHSIYLMKINKNKNDVLKYYSIKYSNIEW